MDDSVKDKFSKLAGFLINLFLSGEVRDDDLGDSIKRRLLKLNFLMLALGVGGAVLVVAFEFYNPEGALSFKDNLRFVVGGIFAGFLVLLALFFVLKGLFWDDTDDSIKGKLISDEVQGDDTNDSIKDKLIKWAGLLIVLGVGGAVLVVASEFYNPEGDLSFDNLRFLAICFAGFGVLLGVFFLLKDYFVDDTDDSIKGKLIKLAFFPIALGSLGAVLGVIYEFADPEGDLSFDNLRFVVGIFAGGGVLIGLAIVLTDFANKRIQTS